MKASRWLDVALAGILIGISFWRVQQGSVLQALLAAQTLVFAGQLVLRREAARESAWGVRLVAWLTALLPQTFETGADGWLPALLQVVGLLIAVAAQIGLGRSFGVAPADRGLVERGAYRIIRHPIYAGELVHFLGVALSAVTWRNGLVFAALLAATCYRIEHEERIIARYGQYAATVRWRLLPGVW